MNTPTLPFVRIPTPPKQKFSTAILRRATHAAGRGKRIRCLAHLARLSDARRSVYHSTWGCQPATWLLSMQARVIHVAIASGMLFEYRTKKERGAP